MIDKRMYLPSLLGNICHAEAHEGAVDETPEQKVDVIQHFSCHTQYI